MKPRIDCHRRHSFNEELNGELDSNSVLDLGCPQRFIPPGIVAAHPGVRLIPTDPGPESAAKWLSSGHGYDHAHPMKQWLLLARQPQVVRRALKVAVVVGTILVAINQGGAILAGALPAALLVKILLTYLVPYCVSTYAAVEALRNQQADE